MKCVGGITPTLKSKNIHILLRSPMWDPYTLLRTSVGRTTIKITSVNKISFIYKFVNWSFFICVLVMHNVKKMYMYVTFNWFYQLIRGIPTYSCESLKIAGRNCQASSLNIKIHYRWSAGVRLPERLRRNTWPASLLDRRLSSNLFRYETLKPRIRIIELYVI